MIPGQFAETEVRLLKILQHRGKFVARDADYAPVVQRLVEEGLVRSVERPGSEAILVLSGVGLRTVETQQPIRSPLS